MTHNNNNDKHYKKHSVYKKQKYISSHTGLYAQRPLNWKYDGQEENLDSVISSFMKNYGMNNFFQEAMFLTNIMKNLGGSFVRHMHPVSFRNGMLLCIVDSPVWNHQYTMMKEQLIERLNESHSGPHIRDIRFKVGKFNDHQYLSIEEEKESKLTSSIEQQSLTEEDRSFLHDCVRDLASDLRPVVFETLEVILKHRKMKGLS